VVFDFSLNSSFGFLCFACGIPRRIGFDYRGRGRFLTDKIPLQGYEDKHVIEYYLDLLKLAQVPVVERNMILHVPSKDIQWAQGWIAQQAIDPSKPLIAVVPGGGASWGKAAAYKRWSVSQYADLMDKIIENFDAAIILLGDSKEEELCCEVARRAHFPLHSAVGQTSILKMAALFKQCRLSILNDGGPLHVAVAVGARSVSIFGPVDPKVYGPHPGEGHGVVQKNLPCQPCYRRFRMAQCGHISCLRDLSVEEVYRKVKGVL
jgi:lipopolysaccharide heptosyltransferase II